MENKFPRHLHSARPSHPNQQPVPQSNKSRMPIAVKSKSAAASTSKQSSAEAKQQTILSEFFLRRLTSNDSDDDFEHVPPFTNLKRKREMEDSDEESGEGLNPPGEYLGVQLTDLGKKNWEKLLNRKTGRIAEPPKKKCQKCDDWMDWRVHGPIQKQRSGIYYQGYCAGVCRKTVDAPQSIHDCVDTLARLARGKDIDKGFAVTCTPEESRKIFRAAWAKHNGKCSCCKVKLLAIGNGANAISKQRNKPGLSYHDPLQDLDFLCIACNRLRDVFSAREVQDVFTKIHEAAQKPAIRRQPTTSEIAHIKKMRRTYSKEDIRIKDTASRNNWSISPTTNSTAWAADLIDIVKKAGCIGTHSGITGTFTLEKHIFKMGFDRIHSTSVDADGKRVKWLHSKGNLKLELNCINLARNSLTVDEFAVWIDRIKQGLFR
ncbi:hypothetical protein HDU78_003129 [Chytriomyces hyalinus]|nr:hypothetical protein HDU78_003129 [Chytriomyces hyalinus]